MQEVTASPLTAWESFYVIVGSSAGALTGLQFVVLAFVAERRMRVTIDTIEAFATPPIVHFSCVLFLAALLSAPWPTLHLVAISTGLMGAFGCIYTTIVLRRAVRQEGYEPVVEDWIWHVILPMLKYAMLLAAAVMMTVHQTIAMFMIGWASLALLFIGIHDAWDTVTWSAAQTAQQRAAAEGGGAEGPQVQNPPRSSADGP